MSNWNPSKQYQKVSEANYSYYANTATTYENTETCVTNPFHQNMLAKDLENIIQLIGKDPTNIHALDACGGSGNVSLKLLKKGVNVTICDISPDLLDIFDNNCAIEGFSPLIHCSEIGAFLSSNDELFDLIIFSSALHHLENIEEVMLLVYERLAPGGIFFSIFDPTPSKNQLSKILMWLDYLAFKMFIQSDDLFPAILRRMRRTLSKNILSRDKSKHSLELRDENLGVLAEYHVETGIDDTLLVEYLTQIGFIVLWHTRYTNARFSLIRRALNYLKWTNSFKLLLTK